MKTIILTLVIMVGASNAIFSQHEHHTPKMEFSKSQIVQEKTTRNSTHKRISELLMYYYNIKNALVASDASSAASNAESLVQELNGTDPKLLSESNIHILVTDAGKIADAKDVGQQRSSFANLSKNIAAVIKAINPGGTVYVQYCPMKQALWLSNEKAIKNPYYGSSMLSCGNVVETIE